MLVKTPIPGGDGGPSGGADRAVVNHVNSLDCLVARYTQSMPQAPIFAPFVNAPWQCQHTDVLHLYLQGSHS